MGELNELIRHLRLDRDLSLDEIRGEWSAPTMSRFERGEIELSDSVVAQMALPLGLDYDDLIYRHILSEENLDNWRSLASELWSTKDAMLLLQNLEKLRVPGTRNDFVSVSTDVISELLDIHATGRQNMAAQVVSRLNDYLANVDEFSRLEGILFSVCLEYLPLSRGRELVLRQVKMVEQGTADWLRIRRLISFCAAVAERAAMENDLKTMREILLEMERLDLKIPENADQRYNVKLLSALYDDLTMKTKATHQKFILVLKTGRFVFSAEVHRTMVRYAIAQGWAVKKDFCR
ncbi:MAG: helix-turn-helix domain-containing protein [Lacticaseibacillus songhuajiangensis]|nr:helix-turn-helix domain-containing protein [Lacticaseibacillus songhuajiangensis]